MNKRIIITGATGLIGRNIFRKLIEKNFDLIIFTTDTKKSKEMFPEAIEYVKWNMSLTDDWSKNLNNIHAVIHLSGAPISGKRWSSKYKERILSSRIFTTRQLVTAFKQCKEKPKVFISSSAVGYYGSSLNNEFIESSPAGKGFLADVCKQWEDETAKAEILGIRRVNIRTGIVLAKDGGALPKMIFPYKLFLGGPIGTGRQWMSWIHIADLVNIFVEAIENENLSGAVNATAPNPVTMNKFAKTLGSILNKPKFFKVPSFVMKALLGEAASIILEGQKVLPKKLLDGNFNFQFSDVECSLKDIFK